MMIRENNGKKTAQNKRNKMIMNTMGRGKSMESGKNKLVLGEYRLEVRMHRRCLNYLDGMDMGNNS
jgi:hypothetical protein